MMKRKFFSELITVVFCLCIFGLSSVTSFASLTTPSPDKALLQQQLFEEIQVGSLDKVKELLQARVSVHDTNDSGSTPLQCAILFNHLDIAKYLIRAGALVNAHNIRDGNTPLHDAVDERNAAIVKLLLNQKADISLQNYGGFTPLDEAQKKKTTLY